jgi:hypothetical protein
MQCGNAIVNGRFVLYSGSRRDARSISTVERRRYFSVMLARSGIVIGWHLSSARSGIELIAFSFVPLFSHLNRS